MRRLLPLFLAAALALTLTACGSPDAESPSAPVSEAPTASVPAVPDLTGVDTSAIPGVEDGVLTVGMECAYAPYNWTQMDDSNGAVPIVNNPGAYANGYDVQMALRICQAYGWELEVMALSWEGLTAALNSGAVDAVIAGQSMTEERLAEVDMAGPYLYATIVCVAREGTPQAEATGISQLTGSCTAQSGTIWYDSCLPQIPGADILPMAESASAMVMAVVSGTADFICTDMPAALGAVAAYDGLVILDFSGTEDDFTVSDGDVNIGISVVKGNTALKDALDAAMEGLTAEHFNALMAQAIAVQPTI